MDTTGKIFAATLFLVLRLREAVMTQLHRNKQSAATNARLDLSTLNAPQREAVMHGEGPLLVLAGAGSGKTRVIIFRIARLIDDGVAPQHILGVTFTNKAAREMRQRLSVLVGRRAAKVTLCTFHALGLAILKEEYRAAGLRRQFCIYDTADQLSLVRELMRQVKVADRRLDAARVLDILLCTKRARLQEVQLDWGDDYELAAFDLYPRYIEQMRAFNAIDFDDLILRSQNVLTEPNIAARWTERFTHLLVDEYQDTSPDQLELIRALAGLRQNICAVGDDDQAIYGWRGAAVDNILAFSTHFHPTHEVVLDQNYRSTGSILHAANAIIRNNKQRKIKQLWSGGGRGEPVAVFECLHDEDEATFVTETIHRLHYDGVSYDDIAILYRSNVQSRIFEETLGLENVPFRVVGGQAFFDRKEVRDALAFLAVAHNPFDEVALRRIVNVPPRGIGAASLEHLADYGERHGVGLWGALQAASSITALPKNAALGAAALVQLLQPAAARLQAARVGEVAPLVRELFAALRMEDSILAADDSPSLATRRLENLQAVQESVARFESRAVDSTAPLSDFLRSASLVRNREEEDDAPKNQVTLMTLHSAKGLEFCHVFMVGVEEDLLPHARSLEVGGGDLCEERRLCYVGMTRARQRLWLSWARHRMRHGKMIERCPSRFLQELPEEGVTSSSRAAPAQEKTDDDMAAAFFKKMRDQLGIT